MAIAKNSSAVGLALLACVAPAVVAGTEWADDLTFQIRDELGCKVNLISQVVERVVDGKRIVMAKVHCEDKRTFDAFRAEAFADFEFNECEPPEQRLC